MLVVPDGFLADRILKVLGSRVRGPGGGAGLLPLVFGGGREARSDLRRFGLLRILLLINERFPAEVRAWLGVEGWVIGRYMHRFRRWLSSP